MRRLVTLTESVTDEAKIQKLVDVLREANGGPLKVKEVAAGMGVSLNTAGKYVDVAEAGGRVRTNRYGSVKQVWLVQRK